jgi:hypothetical protein
MPKVPRQPSRCGLARRRSHRTMASAWAALNHNSDFAVVPEPSTWVLLAGGLTFVTVMRRRR